MTQNVNESMNQLINQTMQAIEISHPGGPEVLQRTTREVPVPKADEVLIEIAAAGINGPDVMQRKGLYNPPAGVTDIPGLEIAGRIVALGSEVAQISSYQVGDLVCALIAGGGYAEYAVAPVRNVMPVPTGLSLIEAASVPETFMTVWAHLFMRAGFSAGKSILIHGGTSGIGTTATMLCRALGATQIFTTVGSATQQQASLELGATVAINYRYDDFVEQVKRHTNDQGVDFVVDIIAGDYVPRNYQAAAMNGIIVQIGVAQGRVKELDLFPMLAKRLTHLGATLRSQTVEQKSEIFRQLQERVWPLFAAGQIKPQLFKTYALQDAHLAHTQLAEGGHIGKLVLINENFKA